MAKYEEATEILQGIGLTPPVNYSLASDFPSFDDPNTVFAFPSNATSQKSTNTTNTGPVIAPVTVPFAKLPLNDFQSGQLDILYYGNVNIGSPSQPMPVDIDTGSADLWVVSGCPDYFGQQLNASNSSTLQAQDNEFTISYVCQVLKC